MCTVFERDSAAPMVVEISFAAERKTCR